jgi:hypothetical protein
MREWQSHDKFEGDGVRNLRFCPQHHYWYKLRSLTAWKCRRKMVYVPCDPARSLGSPANFIALALTPTQHFSNSGGEMQLLQLWWFQLLSWHAHDCPDFENKPCIGYPDWYSSGVYIQYRCGKKEVSWVGSFDTETYWKASIWKIRIWNDFGSYRIDKILQIDRQALTYEQTYWSLKR